MSGRREPPICETARKWLDHHVGKNSRAAFTGQDARAFSTFLHALELYASCDDAGAVHAIATMRHAVLAMQPSTREHCKRAIPCVLDWGDENRVWALIEREGSVDA